MSRFSDWRCGERGSEGKLSRRRAHRRGSRSHFDRPGVCLGFRKHSGGGRLPTRWDGTRCHFRPKKEPRSWQASSEKRIGQPVACGRHQTRRESAYQQIHYVLTAYSTDAASTPQLQELMGAPLGVEILASTRMESGDPLCEVAATGIYWQGGQTAITTQFHPELDESLMTTSQGWAPAWKDMKQSDGIRLLARMLRACLR